MTDADTGRTITQHLHELMISFFLWLFHTGVGGAAAGAFIGGLIAGIIIGVLLDMFVIVRYRKPLAMQRSMNRKDTLARNIVSNPYEASTDGETFSNPAFNAANGSGGSGSGSSQGGLAGDLLASLGATNATPEPGTQWPQWETGGNQRAIAKQWRDSVGDSQDQAAALEAGLAGTEAPDSLPQATLPKWKRFAWLTSIFRKKAMPAPDDIIKGTQCNVQAAESIIQENEMSAILDEVDELAREINGLTDAIPEAGDVRFGPPSPEALADVDVMPSTPGARAVPEVVVSGGAEYETMAAVDEQTSNLPIMPPKIDDVGDSDQLLSRAPMPPPKGDIQPPDPPADSLPSSPVAKDPPSLSAASVCLPKSTSFEAKPSSKLKANPFLKTDQKKQGEDISPFDKKRLSSSSGAGREPKKLGVGHLANKFNKEEPEFKRPSLRSVHSAKSAKSSDSGEGLSPSESLLGAPSGAFSKVSLRKTELTKSPSTTSEGVNSLHHAMSALKKTAAPVTAAPAPAPARIEDRPPPPIPEPLPTESEVDLMEAEEEMYIEPDNGASSALSGPAMGMSMSGTLAHSFSVDTAAAVMSDDNYMVPEDTPEDLLQEEYMEMGDGDPGEMGESYIDMATSPQPEGYMELHNAVSGGNDEYLDMSGSKPPPIAKRKVSAPTKQVAAPTTAPRGGKTLTAPVKGNAQKAAKTGFFGRLFKKKDKTPKGKAVSKTSAVETGARLKPGWKRATEERGAVNLNEEPAPAPPEWVQRLHQQGKQPQYNDDDIYEEYGEGDGDMYEELAVKPRLNTSDKIAKPSEARELIKAEVKQQAISDLKSTPMIAGNVKRLTSHWVKKTE